MTETEIAAGVMKALEAAEAKHPTWTSDAVHAVAILAEEAGELIQAANDFQHAPSPINRDRMRAEALQVGAMVFRFLLHLDEYEGNPAFDMSTSGHSPMPGWVSRSATRPRRTPKFRCCSRLRRLSGSSA